MSGEIEVSIHGLSSKGEGVGRLPDGRAVFVPWTVPGDVVTVRPVREKKRWARAELVTVDRPAESRVEPSCPHFGTCGGCALQHIAYGEQLRWKARLVHDAVSRIAGLELDDVPHVEPAPIPLEYRRRMTFSVVNRQGRIFAGLREADRPGRVVDVERCPLADPAIAELWSLLRTDLKARKLLSEGRLARVTIRKVAEGCVLIWRPRCPGGDPEAFLRLEGVSEVWEEDGRGARRLCGSSQATETWFGEALEVPGPSFTQVNAEAGRALHETVVEWAEPFAGMRVVDAYAGVAVIGRRLALLGAHVTAIELQPWATAAAARQAPPGLEVREGSVEALLPAALPADLVLLNPPRTGIAPEVSMCLAEHGPGRILYVSCDPATLARDLGRLAGTYSVRRLEAFDLFPQTPHVEVLVELARQGPDQQVSTRSEPARA